MDFLKKFITNVIPVNQIIKFIIKQFLSSYLIIKENDLEEKVQQNSCIKNLININNLELNVSNINHEHLLHSPIKLLKGILGRFSLDITDENKIIITIEDVSIDLMPLFNHYKKYQETIFNMEKTKQLVQKESEEENKVMAGLSDKNSQNNQKPQNNNNYMLNMANKLLTNLEINIKNISVKLFTYEISDKIFENPVFSLFIMNINIYKNEKEIKKENIIDPKTNLLFEECFLNNLIIEVDKLCLKLDQNKNEKDIYEFAQIRKLCNNKVLSKDQEERILKFFIAYNTIFAMNYKKGPCLKITLNTKPRKEKYKEIIEEKEVEKEKIVEDMNVQIDIFEAESIITPHQLFNIQILSQISNFIFTLNKNTPNKEDEENEKEMKKNTKKNNSESGKEVKSDDDEENSSSEVFGKDFDDGDEKLDLKLSFIDGVEKKEIKEKTNLSKEIEKKTEILGHQICKLNLSMNAKRIILVILENNNNESIPKLFSFLMEKEIENAKNKGVYKNSQNSTLINFNKSNESFENYYCYLEDNLLFVKIENINSTNTSINTTINVSSVIAEYIKSIKPDEKINDEKEKTNLKLSTNKKSSIEASIYDSMAEYEDFQEMGSNDEDMFQSAIENTELLIMENYNKYINKFLAGEYQSNKFEILIINKIDYNMLENNVDIKEILINLNYIIILLFTKLLNQINYFIKSNNPMFTYDDIISTNDIVENLNVNLEKKINDTELKLFKNLSRLNKNKSSSDDDTNIKGDEQDISLNDSINYSEEEKNKKNGIKININFISVKIYNVAKNISRFDTNIYYYKLFLELVYPNIINKVKKNSYETIEEQTFNELVSKDYLELVLNNINVVFYNISNTSKINIIFQEVLFKYWNYVVIQYNNINKKNNIEENPNVTLSLPDTDIIVDFSEKVRINLEKNILDDLLNFTNTFLYGLSMYQIYDKYCHDLYTNKLVNLFDMFGLKNHFMLLKKIDNGEENQGIMPVNSSKINKDKQEIQEIKQKLDNKPSLSIGGRIISCVININKNGTFEEKEGNLIKIKMVNIGVNLEMFSENEDNNPNKEPVYNKLSLSINNIFFLIKENPIPKEGKPKYYNLFSKNKTQKYEAVDYFVMSFKFRNIKKIRDDIIIEDENESESDENEDKKENNLNKKNSKFEVSNSKISLEKKTTDYIAFLLNNQVKLDNMEMIINIKVSYIVIDSFYHKLNKLSSSLSDFYMDFTNKKGEEKESLDGTYILPSDLIPLCEDRIMFIKCDFKINQFLLDIFLKGDKEEKNWMRLLFIMEKFKFTFNENGIYLNLKNNYVYIMKDFNYIYHIAGNSNINNLLNIEDKVNDIHKEDSYLKRLGYVELFYNDKVKLEKLEKELNVNLGNINIFVCQDTFGFILEFKDVFIGNYLDKIKDIFSQDTLSPENSEEEIEKNIIKNNANMVGENLENEENNKNIGNKDDGFTDEFEVIDDVFFMDDYNKKHNEEKSNKNKENKYLKNNSKGLKTIPEEKHNKIKNKKDSNEMKDDFTVIETKSSLQRQMIREKKEENGDKYLFELESLRLYLFSGNDFNFQDDKKKDLDLSSSNEDLNIGNAYKKNSFDIETNYLFKLGFKNHKNLNKNHKNNLHLDKRKKNDERDYNNYILINILNLSFKTTDFCYFDFIIGNFFIDDNFEKSLYKKIISNQDYIHDFSKFLVCKIDFTNNKELNRNKDVSSLRINLSIPSLDIFVDQLPLNFIIKFLLSQNYDKIEQNNKENENDSNKSDEENNEKDLNKKVKEKDKGEKYDNPEEINSKDSWNDEDISKINESLIYVNKIFINSFTINFHYNSHKIEFKKFISNRDWLELTTSLTDVKDLNLKFNSFNKNTQTILSDIINEIIKSWKDDLENQITDSVLRGFTITRPFFKLYDGIKDLVIQPYIAYKKKEGIQKGIKRGFKSFFVSFSSQGLFFGEKIFRGIKIVAYRKTKLSLKKKSLYKTWVYKINKKQHDYEAHYYK